MKSCFETVAQHVSGQPFCSMSVEVLEMMVNHPNTYEPDPWQGRVKRLVEMMAEQKRLKSNLKRMHAQAEDLDALHTFLMSDSYLLDDFGAFCLFRLKNLAVVLPALAEKASSYLSEVLSLYIPAHASHRCHRPLRS